MAGQALFYEQATALSADRHGDWCVETGVDFAYSRNTNSVPLMAVEFERAVAHYPIVFVAGGTDEILPVAVLGLDERHNHFIDANGRWQADYIPAFVRRYPFIFAADSKQQRFTLCIDESFGGCNQEGRGERLFGADAKPTPFLSRMLGFLGEYQTQHQRTLEFTRTLQQHGLLEEMRADVNTGAGTRASVAGFLAVKRETLLPLDDGVLAGMVRNDYIALIYQHWNSLARFSALAQPRVEPASSTA